MLDLYILVVHFSGDEKVVSCLVADSCDGVRIVVRVRRRSQY